MSPLPAGWLDWRRLPLRAWQWFRGLTPLRQLGVGLLIVIGVVALSSNDRPEEREVATAAEPSTTLRRPEVTGPPYTPTTTTTMAPTTTAVPGLPPGENTTVGSITDGDTFRTADGTRIRLIGVDTPERGDCLSQEATAHINSLIPVGSAVRLVYDVERYSGERWPTSLKEIEYVLELAPQYLWVVEPGRSIPPATSTPSRSLT